MNFKELSHFKNSNKVATKVFLLLVIFSSIMTFTLSATQVYYDHFTKVKYVENEIRNIDKNFIEGFSHAVWTLDHMQIKYLASSLLSRSYIHHLKLETNDFDPIDLGNKNIKENFSHSIPITYTINGKIRELGVLSVTSDKSFINNETKKSFISVFFYIGLRVLATSFVCMLIMTRYVGIPLHNLSRFSRNIFEKNEAKNYNFEDEFAEVADTIKLMYFDLDKNFQEIKKSEERFRDMSQFKKRIVWETDLNLNVTYVSDITRDHCLGRYLLDLSPWKSSKEQLLHKFLLLKSLQSFRDFELNFQNLGSQKYWSVSAKPFFDDKGRHIGYRFVSEDISQSKLMQEELEIQKEQIRQGQKLESLGQITGGLTHDFNNLLMIIQGSLRNISKSIERGTDFNKYLSSANNAVDRGRKLTKKLLVYSRKEVLAPTKQNIDYLVNDMTDILEKCLNEKIKLNTSLSFEDANVLIDPIELENACINMAINSRDAMPEGGEITLRTEKVYIEKSDNIISRGDYIRLSFLDNGKGIPPHLIDKVFEPFFTTKDVGQGTGLGLSQIYGFMKDSKGKVEVNSILNEGTQIDMYFPVYESNEHLSVPII